MKITPRLKRLLKESLKEDLGKGDITTDTLIEKEAVCSAYILAKSNGIICGTYAAHHLLKIVDPKLKIRWHKKDGEKIKQGNVICNLQGKARSVLKAERTVLNFIGWLSGISSATYEFVKKVKGTHAKIYDTRKTTPLWREFEKYAVRTGGGHNHRMGLWDQGFVKDNHWELAKDTRKIASKLRALQSKKWVVEIGDYNTAETRAILSGRPAVVLLDNFSLSELRHEVKKIKKISKELRINPELEASGGVSIRNVRRIAQCGVDRISIGSLTHSSRALDFSLEVRRPA